MVAFVRSLASPTRALGLGDARRPGVLARSDVYSPTRQGETHAGRVETTSREVGGLIPTLHARTAVEPKSRTASRPLADREERSGPEMLDPAI